MQILKKITMLAFLLSAFAVGAMAQLTGTRNIPGDYPTVAAAVTDLNTQGVGAGGITFIVADGYTETAPAGGYTITNPSGNGAGNPIVFRRATSTGTRPVFTANAALTAGALNDAIFKIIGTDNLTIDGFSMLENANTPNTTAGTNNLTEFGVALFYLTPTNGSQNVTIQNCIIDLNRIYQNTFGIYSNSTTTAGAVTTAATATTTDGGNSGLKIYSNSITDVNNGIVVVGPTAAADYNEGLDIGGTAMATGNSITNYGTTGTFSGFANVSGTVNGILVRNTRNFNVSFNSVVSSDGGTTAGTLNGIQVPAFTVAPLGTMTNNINNNAVSLRSGAVAGAINGINVLGTSASATTTLNINNNDFSNTTHTVAAASGTITFLTSASPALTQSITNNTFTNLSVTTTGSVNFIVNTNTLPATGTKNVNNNSIVTAFNKTGAGGTVAFFADNGSDPTGTTNNSNNNNFSNITVTGATAVTGIGNTNGGAPNKNVTGNTVGNITGGTGAVIGLSINFDGGTTVVSGNTVSSITNGGTATGILFGSTGAGTTSATQNTIHTLTGSGAGLVTGISNTGGTTRNISRNKIYNLENSNAGGGASGITVSSGTTVNVFNNLIGDIRTPALNAANSLFGINISGGTTVNADFNTVYLNATSTGALFGSSALNASTTPTVTLRNNILVNTSTANGTGLTVAYRRSSATLTTYGSASNNNDFFAGTPSATNVIFFDGTNSDQTLAAYKTRVAPRDSASITELPNFLSTTGSSANFLHINPATPTQLESGGIPVSGITNDFDGDPRSATTPDIGADEFTGTPIDLNPPTIVYTAPGNTTSTDNRVITATITDVSGVAGGANSPRIYFRKNGGAYSSTACVLTGGSSYSCTIDYSLIGGVTTGDVINYFIVAQDTNGNVGANPGGGFAGTSVNNVTTPPTTPNAYTIVAGFAASVNVGAGETYTSLTNAGGLFEALNAAVLTNNVTINLTADLTAETGAVALNQLNEEGANPGTYAVTIKPSGAARTISGTGAAIIRLNGADRVTIDGSLSGGTDRSLTITNTSTATGTAAIQIASTGVGAGATNNTVRNTNISCGADQSTSTSVTYGITHGGAGVGSSGADNDNNSFVNNAITRVNVGIFSSGESAANPVQNTVISNNLIGPAAFGSDQIGRVGIVFNLSNAASVTGNEVRFVGVTEPQTAAPTYDKYGIAHAFAGWSETVSGDLAVSNSLITRNRIHDVVEENTYAAVGIFMAGGNGTNDTLNTTANNFIYNVRANGTFGDNSVGIGIASGRGDTVAFNSIYMAGDLDPGVATASSVSSFGIQIPTTAVVNLNLRNNISYVDLTSNTATLLHGSISLPASFSFGTGGANYNDYYVLASNPQSIIGRVGTVTYPTFAAYQSAVAPQEANSKSVDPLFVSATDLHIQAGSPVIASGTPISGITTDIDGDTRDAVPDIGADEIVNFVAPTVQFSAAGYTGAEGTTATITVTRTGDTTAASTVNYATSNGTATGAATCGAAGVDYQTASGTLNFAAGEASRTFTVTLCSDSIIKGDETINLTLTTPTGATLGTQSTAVLTITNVNPPMPGTLALSAATYSVGEAGGTATITVNRTGGTDGAVSVAYTLSDGTATGGAACGGTVDYVNAGGTVNFAASETSKTFTVTICNDTALEGNETFNVALSGATGGATVGTPSTAVVTILDDEVAQPGILQFAPAAYTVGEAGSTVTLTVTRTGGTDGAVGASYTFADGTATGGATCAAGVDFINTGGTVGFTAGQASQTISVTICNDSVFEGSEAFTATLASATGGATIGAAATATVTITDDEVAQNGTVQFSAATYTVTEAGATATITITRTGGSDGSITVDYATVTGGTATGAAACAAGVDYVNTSGTATFGAGVTTAQTFTIPICNDTVNEPSETVNLALTNATGGATIGTPSTAVLTITDDDLPTGIGGSVNVGAGQTYTSLTNTGGIFEAINTQGATSNITINITSDLTGETGTVALNEVAGGFTVTIKPTGAARTISGSSTSGIIKLNGADFVTIDGSLTGGTATGVGGDQTLRNLTVQNTSTTATAGAVIVVSSTATTNIGAHDNTIKNVNISGQAFNQTLIGIALGGQAPGSAGTDNDNNRVENCSFQKSFIGIYNVGASATNPNTGNVVTRNDLSATGDNRLRRAGIFFFNQDGIQATENSVGGIVGDESADAIGIIAGIQNVTTTAATNGGITNALISRNRINGIASTSTVGFSAAGIAVAGGTTGANTIANNMITGVTAPSTSPDLVAGIFVAGVTGSDTRLYYNSVALTGERGTVASQIGSYGVAISGTNPVVELKNNIFYNTQTSGGGANAKSYAIGLASTTFSNFNSNYNDFYSSGANAGFFRTGGLGATATDYANLAAFRTATGSDANSQEVDPLFVNPANDLHLQATSPVLDDGTPIAAVTVDFDGETRSATTPDIGADEVAGAAPQNGTLALSSATYTIAENFGSGVLTVAVTRTGGTDGAVSATYTLTDGTATGGATCAAGVDYINTGGTVSFTSGGPTTQTFTVAICNDSLIEGNETFNVTLSNATGGATIGTPATAVVTITDDDVPPPVLAFASATFTASESAGSVTITVTRTGDTSGPSGATYTFANGTANGGSGCGAGVDYVNTSGIVTFFPGETSKTFTAFICNDALIEGTETFSITLAGASGATIGTPSTTVVSITDDELPPTISINSVSQNEGNAGTTAFTFTVTLSAASGQTVTVNYFTADGTATAGSDYTAIPNTVLTFAPGETTKTITVNVNGDTTVEPNETFNVNLATPTNATIATAQGIGTIINDDVLALGSVSINDVDIVEGDSGQVFATFTVTLTNPNGQASSVQYSTANGTATAGSDYVATSGTLNFAPGEITKTVTVTIIGDTLREATETFFVNLSNPIGVTIGDGQGLGTIIDDDRAAVADFDNDGKTDLSVFRPSNGTWYVLQSSNNGFNSVPFGTNGDVPTPGDYDNDGRTDYAVFRPSNGTWYVLQSSNNGFVQRQFGLGSDKPVQGDYNGDGATDIAVFRPSNGTWYVSTTLNGGQFTTVPFGTNGDIPVQGDYDGDAKTDYAVYRGGIWYVLNSANGAVTAINFGLSGDKPLVGDFDGDGKADFTVYRSGVWYIFQSQTGTVRAVSFGTATDVPVVGDYDGDGTSDIAVFRNGNWFILNSSNNGFNSAVFGTTGDIPVPAAYQSLQ